MNREERRRTAKNGTFMGVLNDIKIANQFKAAIEGDWPIKEGDKVKLNLDAIMKHPGYQQQLPAYRKFCEENTETVFTVAYDERLRQSIELPPLRVLLWRRFQKELVYGYIVAEHKLKENL